MAISTTPDLTSRRYIQQGECLRCGKCCLTINCEYLEIREIATCKIHDSPDRPEDCGLFPEAPPIMIRGCGYYFLDTWENNRIVRAREV